MTDTDDPPAPRCPGCGLRVPDLPVLAPPSFHASPGCWHRFGQLLAADYSDPERARVHQLVVDSYVVQHPTNATRKQVQQVALCLMTMALFIEDGVDVRRGADLHKQMVANLPPLHALDPPDTDTGLTVADVLAASDADDHERLVRAWAAELWTAWHPHHHTVHQWNQQALNGRPGEPR